MKVYEKKVIAVILSFILMFQTAPVLIVEAAQATWNIVISPETPLDQVYFYDEDTSNDNEGYFFGYLNGKVAIMNRQYSLIKQTEFDTVATKKFFKYSGKSACLVIKKVGGKNQYGIISSTGTTLLSPEYSYISTNYVSDGYLLACKYDAKNDTSYYGVLDLTGNVIVDFIYDNLNLSYLKYGYLITYKYDEDAERNLYAILDLDGNRLSDYRWRSVGVIGEQDGHCLMRTRDKDGKYSILLDGSIIYSAINNGSITAGFTQYEEHACIRIYQYNEDDDEDDEDHWSMVSLFDYSGKAIKSMSYDEWNFDLTIATTSYLELFKNACDTWLNDKKKEAEDEVISLLDKEDVTLSEIDSKTAYTSSYQDGDNSDHIFYWIVIRAKKEAGDSDDEYHYIYFNYIYNSKQECLASGKSFSGYNSVYQNGKLDTFYNQNFIILNQDGEMTYWNEEMGKVENLFKVGNFSKTALYVEDGGNYYTTSPDYCRLDILTGDKEVKGICSSENYVYDISSGKKFDYDYRAGEYFFVSNDSSQVEVYRISDEIKKCGVLNSNIDSIKNAKSKRTGDALLLQDNTNQMLYYINGDFVAGYSYESLSLENGFSIYDLSFQDNFISIVLKGNDNYKWIGINTVSGDKYISGLSDDDVRRIISSPISILDSADTIYFARSTEIVSWKKETKEWVIETFDGTFGTTTVISDTEESSLEISSLIELNQHPYIQYLYEYRYDIEYHEDGNGGRYSVRKQYGIMDLSGAIKLDASTFSENNKISVYGDYINTDGKLYNKNFQLLSNNVSVSRLYKGIVYVENYDGKSDLNSFLFDTNTNHKITNCENDYYFSCDIIGNYYYLKGKIQFLVEKDTDKIIYQGDGFIYTEEAKKTITIFAKKESVSDQDKDSEKPSATPDQKTDAETKDSVSGHDNKTDTLTSNVAHAAPLKAGSTIKVSGVTYTVTKAGMSNGTVSYTKPKSKKVVSVKIPDVIKKNGITYKVTAISANAFKSNKKLKNVTIGKNVVTIGKKAFYGCKNLRKITIKTTRLKTKTVGTKAFKGIYAKAVIKVPKKKLTTYQNLLKKKGISKKNKGQKITPVILLFE